ncbi:class I SAM-dependent methyltransferase [Sciscionella sediminilitoris]|uniref:class I SAM-dependent methyltransferase n=1 Tax=Sciscionella sediminilitoris TaxID=1445613 RepID=UPI0004DF80AF|nr:class I SAM-dependent methyltransferase [Sciscionella sp. SE31]
MTSLGARLIAAMDRFHAARPWDHNAHYHRLILRQLPEKPRSALDIGCGTGEFARKLAATGARVDGIDTDPAAIAGATRSGGGVRYLTADVRTARLDRYATVVSIATVHHLPLTEALPLLRGLLEPGGTLVVLGLYRKHTISDRLLGLAAAAANLLVAALRGRNTPRTPPMCTKPAGETLARIRSAAATQLPGARIRRLLFWRYILVYEQP